MFHRFNQLSNALKNSKQLESLLPQGLRNPQSAAVQKTYTPILGKDNEAAFQPNANKHNPHGWKSWKDIPDSFIPTSSTIDPNNKIYQQRHYIDNRKKQIWYQIPDGTPVWLKGGTKDYIFYYGVISALMFTGFVVIYDVYWYIFKNKPEKCI